MNLYIPELLIWMVGIGLGISLLVLASFGAWFLYYIRDWRYRK